MSAQSTAESKTYWAAVVEFSSEPVNQNSADSLENAVNAYVDLIESPEAAAADIIVFPESTLNGILTAIELPDPEDNIAPCNNDSFHLALQNISCSAARVQKYVVINLTEQRNVTAEDSDDTEEETLYYNANVVLDREGRVISRYRKFNLFGEKGISVTDTPDVSYFTTDFNVTFGHFICFDLMFKTPALELMNNELVTDILFPTMWFSELPFLSAVQAQNMWVLKQEVNFLAAGAGNPSWGSTGSGVYSKHGLIKGTMTGDAVRRVFLTEVPKKQFWDDAELQEKFTYVPEVAPQNDALIRMKRDHLEVYTAKYLDFDRTTSFRETLCYGDELCCEFEISGRRLTVGSGSVGYRYFIVAFDGVRSYDGFATGGTFTCGLISCVNDTLAGCGMRFGATEKVVPSVAFDVLKIQGKLRDNEDILSLPNTVNQHLMPLPTDSYEYKEVQGQG